jgi:hypothetical protein
MIRMKRALSVLVEPLVVAVIVVTVWAAPKVPCWPAEPSPDEALLAASWTGDQGAFEAALARGASARARDVSGATPLHYAALNGDPRRVSWLIALGANVNAQSKAGATPLISTVTNDHVVAAEMLLRCGAEPSDEVLHAAEVADARDVLRALQLWRDGATKDSP